MGKCEEQCCGNCAFWKNMKSEDFVTLKTTVTKGECHRCPPQVNGHLVDFPAVYDDQWCGAYKRTMPGDKYYDYNQKKAKH